MQQSGAKTTLTALPGITAVVQIRFEAVSQGRFITRLLDGPNWWDKFQLAGRLKDELKSSMEFTYISLDKDQTIYSQITVLIVEAS